MSGGLLGLIALWRLVLPRVAGHGVRESLSAGLIVGLTCGGIAVSWVLIVVAPNFVTRPNFGSFSLLYITAAALVVAVHQAASVIGRKARP